MKILHVIIGLNAGGAEHALRRLIESHRGSSAFHHSIVSLTDAGALGGALRAAGISVQAMGMHSIIGVPSTVLRLTKLIRRQKPDVIQSWMYHADLIGGVAARLAGNGNIIWGVRGADMITGTAYSTFVIRRICALLSRIVPAAIICPAEASRLTHTAIGYDPSKTVVIQNGFEPPVNYSSQVKRRAFRAIYEWSDDEFVVGCIGRFNYYKDHANFIKAAGLLAERYPSARFLMVGKGLVFDNTELRDLITNTGFADRFRLLGLRDDVLNCLSAMDVFCLSSRSEAFPNVVGEAMSMGLPCVATDVGDVRLLLSDTGVIVPKEDAQALFMGLAQIIEMPPVLRKAMGDKARSRVIAEFSMARTRERFEAIYLSLPKRANPTPQRT